MKTILTFVAALLFIANSFGQKSMLKFQVGYGIPLTNSLADKSAQVNSSTTTYTGVYGSYGSGLRLEAGYIHTISSHLYLEMDVAYLMGKPIDLSYDAPNSIQRQSRTTSFYEISPLLRANLGGKKVKPYAAIGPVFGLGSLTFATVSSTPNAVNVVDIRVKYSGSLAIGAKCALGAEFTQGRFVFFAQITMIAMSYSPGKSELTKYTVNGADQLSMLTVSQKQTEYKTNFTAANNGSYDPNQPTQQIKFYFPYSNISLNAGIMFKI